MPEPDLVSITSGGLSARINTLGAELWSLTDGAGREFMTSGDPAFWSGHAPLLFPIVGALNGGSYRLAERSYRLPKHGFARTSVFELVEHKADTLGFRLAASEATRAVYPFEFILEAEFVLRANTLATAVTVTNAGGETMPFSFGFHPAFAWPLPDGGSKQGHRILFERDEPAPIRRIDPISATLLPEPEPTPVVGRTLRPDAPMFEMDALIWDRLVSRSLVFESAAGTALTLDFPDCPNLGVWQKPGAPFLAIEPWQGFNDPHGFSGDLRDKPGILGLAPGEERCFRMDVTVHAS